MRISLKLSVDGCVEIGWIGSDRNVLDVQNAMQLMLYCITTLSYRIFLIRYSLDLEKSRIS